MWLMPHTLPRSPAEAVNPSETRSVRRSRSWLTTAGQREHVRSFGEDDPGGTAYGCPVVELAGHEAKVVRRRGHDVAADTAPHRFEELCVPKYSSTLFIPLFQPFRPPWDDLGLWVFASST
jgi:hypothetical protein